MCSGINILTRYWTLENTCLLNFMGMCFVKEQLNMNACCDFKDNAFFFGMSVCIYVKQRGVDLLRCVLSATG